MFLEADEMALVCEHKIDSPLGDEQLQRYLRLVQDKESKTAKPYRLALITHDPIQIPAEVRLDRHYCKPEKEAHFRWQDLYRVLQRLQANEESSSSLPGQLRDQFLRHLYSLGFSPMDVPIEIEVIFSKERTPEVRQKRLAFGEYWRDTRNWFTEQGYRAQRDSQLAYFIWTTSDSQIPENKGISHFTLEPGMGNELPFGSNVERPCVAFCVNSYAEDTPIIKRLASIERFTLEISGLKGVVVARKIGRVNRQKRERASFYLPLNPFLEAPDRSDALCKTMVEIYTAYVLPAFLEKNKD